MGSLRRNLFILTFVIGLVIGSLLVLAATDTKLGLDLRGGTELIYEGRATPQNPEIEAEDIDRAIEIIRERTDRLGVAEPEISQIGIDQIRVGLPDVQEAERAIEQVGTTAQLFFYDWEPNVIPRPGVQDPANRPYTRLYEAVQLAAEREPECDECTAGPRYYLFDSRSQQLLAGPEQERDDLFIDQPDQRQPPGSEVIEVPQGTLVLENPRENQPDTDVDESDLPPSYFVIRDRPELSGADIRNPEQNFDPQTNQPNVTFNFSDEGRQKFADVTRRIAERGAAQAIGVLGEEQASALSHHFAVVLDNRIVSRPIINFQENPAGIDGRTGAQISGTFTIQQAQDLANFLRIGALPVELALISQSTVSASLGAEALDQGLRAGIAGLIIVVLFLIFFYRLLGLVAGMALLTYAIFFYALIKAIPITLTLPGIAGLILTIGVAADTNIVIFERIKEEVRAGKTIRSAIAVGYRKGLTAVIDANVVTLITAFILFVLATAGVKGFAFTLGVGTLVSLFTAIVFTQAILGTASNARFMHSASLLGAGTQRVRWHLDFAGMSKWFFSFSGVILAIGAFSFATKQLNFGIDFESGTRINVAIEQDAEIEEVRTTLRQAGLEGEGSLVINRVTSELEEGAEEGFTIQGKLTPEETPRVQTVLGEEYGVVQFDSTTVGPTFGATVARSAVYAIIFSLLVVSGYVAFRFQPKFAIPVMIAVSHDLLLTTGIYSLAGREVTSATVAALLTIIGYSLYDTVIVFDRIRENLPRLPRATFSQVVNRSVSEVLTRSILTSLSTAFVILVLLIFGGTTLQDFAFALLVGIITGAYSSIFIAAPVLLHWKEREPLWTGRRDRLTEEMGYVPAFPEDNVVAKVPEKGDEDADRELAAPAPSRGQPAPPQAAEPGGDEPSGGDGAPAEPAARGGDGAPQGGDGAPGEGPPGEPPLAGVSPKRNRRSRRQRRKRRKHGRHR